MGLMSDVKNAQGGPGVEPVWDQKPPAWDEVRPRGTSGGLGGISGADWLLYGAVAAVALGIGLVLLSQKVTVSGISESFMEANRTEATGAGMGRHGAKDIESRFTGYVEELVSVIGHADRAGPFRDYCTGLVMPGERKSVEPMAAITAPGRTA